MTDEPCRDHYEDRQILMRLGLDSPWANRDMAVIAVIRPAGQAAVQRLEKRGLVSWSWGEGKDAGVMLVRRAANGRTYSGGGAVA